LADDDGVAEVEQVLVRSRGQAGGFTNLKLVFGSDLGDSCGSSESEFGKVEMEGGFHGSSKHGGISSDVSKMVIVSELALSLDVAGGLDHFCKAILKVTARVSGDQSQLVFVVDPANEVFVVIEANGSEFIAKMFSSAATQGFIVSHVDGLLEFVPMMSTLFVALLEFSCIVKVVDRAPDVPCLDDAL